MDIRRLSFALAVALLLSAGATYFLYLKMRNQHTGRSATIPVVAASQPLKAGTALTSENVAIINWPANLPITGAMSKPDEIIGRSLIYPVNPNQPILQNDLAQAGSGIGLSVKIPDGMRAMSVRSNDVVGVAGFLYPGSHVDVVLTYRPENSPVPISQTILQNVTVLTAGQTLEPDPKGKAEQVNVVTVLLSPQDAQKMALATQQGTIQFVLRNGADQKDVDTKPVLMAEMVGGEKPQGKGSFGTVHRKRVVPPKNFYSVETIAGQKHTVDKFE
ncbi:MAG: Flp pilus assembly protein CpaB [Acidobacteriaceae bacterium]